MCIHSNQSPARPGSRRERLLLFASATWMVNGTTQAINVPYPDSGVYENYILHYPDATSTEILDINIDQLYSEVMVLTDAKIERAYEYILEERDPGNSTTNVLITVGVDDQAVFDGSATSYLHQLQNDYGFRSIVVSIGSQANYLGDLAESKDWYFTATESNSQWVADQISRIISSTPVGPSCATPYTGRIVTVFELNAVQPELQDVVTFVRNNSYNSANYDFTGITQAINVPYGDTDNYGTDIQNFGDSKSLIDLQSNIDTLFTNADLIVNPSVSDGLAWLRINREPPAGGSNAVIIVVGYHEDDNFGLTSNYINQLHAQGYKFISVAVGANHGNLSAIADKPEWYFQVGDSNGQSVADQISSILCSCNPSTSTVPLASPGTSTAMPTIAPDQCYYQSNVAVAFETSSTTNEIDLQIQNFITNNLFFYSGAPYILGNKTDTKTELSLVPYPNEDQLIPYMTYGEASTATEINTLMSLFQQLSQGPSSIADAFNIIPKNSRIGPPGFVILVANSADSVQNAIASATNLKNLGFKIITVAYKSSGSFKDLSSDPNYNFQIRQDADQSAVAMAIGTILNSSYCLQFLLASASVH
ncbi:hypothetical protein GCK72_006318 [Caenorhabditis remanei]|uniref:VWFA domain-containing protein n=1 Tax=Caenorhabditis remanei TaxID=31234 RepID=A0A6A5HH38_CAERE|nr:hypothetical protein GCK72_006318 [Caenorhabditis remanei]KAF1766361.1 hypothetical protein GCK72_006318 [Caenorhabditis remanei]